MDGDPGHYAFPSALAVSVLCVATEAFPCHYWMGVSWAQKDFEFEMMKWA